MWRVGNNCNSELLFLIENRLGNMSVNLGPGESGLRRLLVPSTIMAKFESIAEPNTSANIETCGFLGGKLYQNQFKITHLLIPKQSGTSNSCETINEEDLVDYMEKNDLITLGAIHTHPTQAVFMSSIDLHTQLSFQMMLPEALSIVVSPRHNKSGFFSLTRDYGLNLIANCHKTGFHPHRKELPIYEEARHVQIDHHSDIAIVDLRLDVTY